MPTHSRVDLLRRAVDSILSQDCSDFELIVVDDGSSDDTASYLSVVSSSDSRVRFLSNPLPLGACVSRNRAMKIAGGDFLTGVDDDDFVRPDHLSTLLSEYNRHDGSGPIAVFPKIMTMTSSDFVQDGIRRRSSSDRICLFPTASVIRFSLPKKFGDPLDFSMRRCQRGKITKCG